MFFPQERRVYVEVLFSQLTPSRLDFFIHLDPFIFLGVFLLITFLQYSSRCSVCADFIAITIDEYGLRKFSAIRHDAYATAAFNREKSLIQKPVSDRGQ